ncbi:Hsp20 family protein [Nonomuraea phyllanthi]|uniref:Hsp20/alpha crystallin family protein n=1 Tax=Nonomuraea phyllanthi TaxID=2219224 RepID=UPI00129345AC|nr:Hsp20/alpha crystallin family protein [Nonomuraea phyllanthi]QFY09788.1 Hsp20 family protein [Nonomuraea phyllanthi]
MLLTSIDPFVQEFERQFDRLTRQAFGNGGSAMPMDGLRRKDDVVLRFDLPGIDPDSIEVTVDRGVLTVRIPVLDRAKPRKVEISRGGDTKAIKP